MQRIVPYQPPTDRFTIRELIEGRAAGAEEGGIAPAGLPQWPPKSAYRQEERVAAEQRVVARSIQPWRGEEQRGAQRNSEEP